jgi:hypothetical protein
MVQAIENLTQIVGTATAREPHPTLAEYDIVAVKIERAQPIEGKANLLAVQPGESIDVTMRRALLPEGSIGRRIHFRARRTPDGAMCEPHPEAGDFRIE